MTSFTQQADNDDSKQRLTPTLQDVAYALKNGKKTMEVDADYLVELIDYFQYNTNYTIQTLWDCKERVYRAQQREIELVKEIGKLTNKVNELLMDMERKQGVSEDESAMHGTGVPGGDITGQIPISKIIGFLNSKGMNRFGNVYIKLDGKGNFIKFGNSEIELL